VLRPALCSLIILQLVNRFETFFLLIFQYKYLKSCSEDFYLIRPQGTTRVPGLGQITWRIVLTKKMRVHLGKKLHENREIASDWAVGVWVHRNSWLGAKIGASPETKNKHSKIAFAITSSALTLGHLGPRMLGFAAQSPIWSPGTLFPYINMNSLNFFVTIRYQLPKGKLAGLALKYYWFKKPAVSGWVDLKGGPWLWHRRRHAWAVTASNEARTSKQACWKQGG